jgi:hypothetical protein
MRKLLVLLLLVGCGTKPPSPSAPAVAEADPTHGYCDVPDQGLCADFPADAVEDGAALCTQIGGSWSSAGCPTANRLGTCTNPERGGGAQLHVYLGAVFGSAEQARQEKCSDDADVFTPSP